MQSLRILSILVSVAAASSLCRADIFRWDNGNVISGSEGIEPGPGTELWSRQLQFADLAGTDLRGASFKYSNLNNATFETANLSDVDFRNATVRDADFTGAIVAGAKLSVDFTKEQVYATASYQEKDLHGISFGRFDSNWGDVLTVLSGWDLSSQNLTGVDFQQAIVTKANLTLADTRGATGLNLEGAITSNLIYPSGQIHGLDLAAGQRLVAASGVPSPVQLGPGYSIDPEGTFDLTDNVAIVDSGSESRVRDQILSGRGGHGLIGAWNGVGITSSAAAEANQFEPGSRSLGYADNAFPLAKYKVFHGVPVSDSSVLVAYTRTGDANLDGVVNDTDVTITGAFYAPGLPQPSWAFGDFDYNGFVDDDDMTLLGAFYDPSAPPLNSLATPGADGELHFGVSAVPEASTAWLALVGVAIAASALARARRACGFIVALHP